MGKTPHSIAHLILSQFIGIIALTFLLGGYFIFSHWQSSARQLILQLQTHINDDVSEQIEAFLTTPVKINESNHHLLQQVIDLSNPLMRDAYFANVVLSADDTVYSFSYGSESGDYYGARRLNKAVEIYENNQLTHGKNYYYQLSPQLYRTLLTGQTENFDPRTRQWYQLAKSLQKPVFSPIYKHFILNDLTVSASYPIYDSAGALQGVLGTHLTLNNLNGFLARLADTEIAAIYIIERDTELLVANSQGKSNTQLAEGNQLTRLSITDITDAEFAVAYQQSKNSPDKQHIFESKQDNLYIKINDIDKEGLHWRIITVIPERPFVANIYKSIRLAILVSLLSLLLAIIISKKSTELILRPLHELVTVTEEFAKGNFTKRVPIYPINELGVLSSTFNKMADQLSLHVSTLEDKIQERTKSLEEAIAHLQTAKQQAEDANRVKGFFLAAISHEIRTPMNSVLGMLELLENTPLTKQQQHLNATAKMSSEMLLKLLNDILDFSKLDAGQLSLYPEEFSLPHLVQDVIDIVQPQATRKDLTFATRLPQEIPSCLRGDVLRIKQILLNLLTNAIKFTPSGSITLTASSSPATEDNIVNLYFRVEDTGIGIPAEKSSYLFQPFMQIDASRARTYGGSGLGLSISKQLVEMMHGEIGYEPSPSGGSVFWFTLPLQEVHSLPQIVEKALPYESEVSWAAETLFCSSQQPILVAEDNMVNQELILLQMQQLGLTSIDFVNDGEEAIAAITQKNYALILMDCLMPVMDGFTATKKIRSILRHHVPIIAITALDNLNARPEFTQAGFDDFISKPLRLSNLKRLLTTWLPAAAAPDAALSSLPSQNIVIDFTVLDKTTFSDLQYLKSLQGTEAITRAIQAFFTIVPPKIAVMKQLALSLDTAELAREAHSIRSSTLTLGAKQAAEFCRLIEQAISDQDYTQLSYLVGKAEEEYYRACLELKKLL